MYLDKEKQGVQIVSFSLICAQTDDPEQMLGIQGGLKTVMIVLVCACMHEYNAFMHVCIRTYIFTLMTILI